MSDVTHTSQYNKPSCKQIIDIMPAPFVIIDCDYQIISANQSYLKQYNIDPDNIEGKRCYQVSHHSDEPCSQHGERCPLEEVFRSGSPAQVMHIHFDNEGNEEYVQLQAAPILSESGEVMYMGEYIQVLHPFHHTENTLVGRAPAFMRMTELLQRVAPSSSTVLLLGESGVGKECVAEYIHKNSDRSDKEFIVVDCSTLGENLIESELFGYEKGAFTGANKRKTGLFEAAKGGTIFIDEVGELPLVLQTKLLRALESGMIRRLGGNDYINIDVRVIAATNRDMQSMVAAGQFRQDLYYRLSAFPVYIPPLRERKEDLGILSEYFLSQSEEGIKHLPLDSEVIQKLNEHDFPGNVRELRNILERATILAYDDVIRTEHIVLDDKADIPKIATTEKSSGTDLRTDNPQLVIRSGRLTEQLVMETLQKTAGHRGQAASILGISERTLYRHIRKMRATLT